MILVKSRNPTTIIISLDDNSSSKVDFFDWQLGDGSRTVVISLFDNNVDDVSFELTNDMIGSLSYMWKKWNKFKTLNYNFVITYLHCCQLGMSMMVI